ncbi:IS6 family transposase [Photobacterium carnosum]|uniref:IS6 family transposase n=1 Tax=Photobacterium carnosum TaxID=2023717 RepID=UPI001F338734|nr:IS6 family transposase [Photobacterium carnosum]
MEWSTLNRWVIRFAPLFEISARQLKRPISSSWRMDEAYINIKGEWWYYYRAIDKHADIVDFYFSRQHDEKAASTFLRKAIGSNGLPHKVVIDKSGTNTLALHNMNVSLWRTVIFMLNLVEIVDIKYLNNIVEQSHRPIKQRMIQALGWKSVEGATATMSGQEVWTLLLFTLTPTSRNRAKNLTNFCPCDLKSYEALFTAYMSEPSVSLDEPTSLNKAAARTM